MFVFFTQVWCVLEACYTAPACPLVGGPAALCLAWRYVTLTTAPRGVAAQTAAITMMCASAVCNCELSPSSYIILIVVIHSPLGRITHANTLAKKWSKHRALLSVYGPIFHWNHFQLFIFSSRTSLVLPRTTNYPKKLQCGQFWRPAKAAALYLADICQGTNTWLSPAWQRDQSLVWHHTEGWFPELQNFKPIFQKVEQAKQVQVNFPPFCSVKWQARHTYRC